MGKNNKERHLLADDEAMNKWQRNSIRKHAGMGCQAAMRTSGVINRNAWPSEQSS